MADINIIVVFVLCVLYTQSTFGVKSETVFYTNSQSQLERSYNTNIRDRMKTYQLEVPGSDPITIIEAEPEETETNNRAGRFLTKGTSSSEFNDRKTKDYIVPGSTHESIENDSSKTNETGRCFGSFCHDKHIASTKKTVYSPELLNKFLAEYAEKIKNADPKTKEKLQLISFAALGDDSVDSEKGYEKKKVSEKIDIQVQKEGNRRYSVWDEVDTKNHQHPFDDHEGWVAMEAVPWTRSKISKWQANTQKVNRPNNNHYSNVYNKDPPKLPERFSYGKPDDEDEPDFDVRPVSPHKPNTNKYDYRPSYDYSQQDDEWSSESPRPSWNKPFKKRPSQNSYNTNKKPHHSDCNHEVDNEDENHETYNRRNTNYLFNRDGIITDGRPGDFPSSAPEYTTKYHYRKPSRINYDEPENHEHPSSHPLQGDGQWVLLSTTKGYKFPKNRQRSLSISPSTLTSHRSVRLTVLPAVNGSKENMTLSHGGLLEVEPSFQTVDESRRIYERAQRINGTRQSRPKKTKKIVTTDPTPDGSAVMAAVGAGLVPATMAMIMPMVLGRKRRDIVNPFVRNLTHIQNVTQNPESFLESTLQRTL